MSLVPGSWIKSIQLLTVYRCWESNDFNRRKTRQASTTPHDVCNSNESRHFSKVSIKDDGCHLQTVSNVDQLPGHH